MSKNIFCVFFLLTLVSSCSTKVYLSKPSSLTGKTISLGFIDITRQKRGEILQKDSVCTCISLSVAETLYPYLQKAGAVIVNMTAEQRITESRLYKAADSLHIDYLLSGTGLVNRTGSTDFMQQLNIQLVSVRTKEIIFTGSFSGPSVTPAGAADRIGKKTLQQK